MLHIGERIAQLRKEQKLSQDELAREVGVSRTIVGNYERGSNAPSIDVLLKLARVFHVTVDYLLGESELSGIDKDLLQRIEGIEQLDEETRTHLLFLIDNVLQNHQARKAFRK